MHIQFVNVRFASLDCEQTIAMFGEERDMKNVIQKFVDDAKRIYKWDEDHDYEAVLNDVLDRLTDAGYVYQTITIDEVLAD